MTEQHLAEGAVGSGKLAPESVMRHHLAERAVSSAKLAPESVMRHHLADGAVSSGKLAPESVMEHHLAEGAVSSRHIVQGAIASEHLSPRCVTGEALADQAVTGEKIADGSIGPEKLNFPVFFPPVMQCGNAPFSISESERETEVEVPLDFPFAHEGYVVVAMTDRSGCWALLRERKTESFTLAIQHDGTIESRVEGTVFWIGMGRPDPAAEELSPGEAEPASATEEEEREQVPDAFLLNGDAREISEGASSEEVVSTIQSIAPSGDSGEEED